MMNRMTPSGVVYDLTQSPFIVERNGYEFRFSSNVHREKYIRDVRMKEDWLTDSLSKRFHFIVEAKILADFQLYMQIEKRGFYVTKDGVDLGCPQDLRLVGMSIKGVESEKLYGSTTQR
jgi:hypothetical protein